MISYEEAKKIGISACVSKLGEDFVNRYEENSCSGFGDGGDYMYCFMGISKDHENIYDKEGLFLNNTSKWPYIARCNVWYKDGEVEFLDCILP